MRLFAALLPPEDVLAQLGAVVDELQVLPGADGLRWTSRRGWHFTLAFYGEVDEDVVPELSAGLARTARRTEPFGLTVRGGGQFGDGRALWAGVEGDVSALRQLAEHCEEAAVAGEHRRYRAHLTVARSREATDVRPYLDRLDDFAGRPWTVDELVLVRSNLPRSGVSGEQPRYEAVGRWGFGVGG
ncbi:RNA 2',3'-cyclic phosphodiesterase [Streptomyces sp. W16]|uniref:RNA 2',3'-cyclic phosphodiesterase n=1 Tax=Streptomyces sp. W16 TaxID=3076631 RepID=UPI00295B0060|nr:RNA 2',3'-cyclic phosphodiesterase [Streptomyces sp. W16]MDV9169740.1 RNA 2',3'-cyclic phosphodiesterase [Streptomyces sp. W16]